MPRKKEVTEETWNAVRLEYISAGASMRALEKKYGIPFNRIRTRLENENWMAQREALSAETTQKSLDKLADIKSDECVRAFKVANKALDKLEECIESLDAEDPYATRNLKNITSAIKDLKEIGVFRSNLDRMEQEARINKLRKDAEEEQKDTTITVTFAGDIEEYGD